MLCSLLGDRNEFKQIDSDLNLKPLIIMNTCSLAMYVAFALFLASVSARFEENPSNFWIAKGSYRSRVLGSVRRRGVCNGLTKQKGFRAILMYIADGKYSQLSPNPKVPNCSGPSCDGAYFWREVAGLSDNIRRIETENAKKFFNDGWGIPVDEYVRDGKITFIDMYGDPRLNYRCRIMEGMKIHRFGWEVHDQAFMVITLQDLKLGGKFGAGRTVPAASFVVTGQYYIERSRIVKGRVVGTKEFVKLRYESVDPVYPPVDGKSMASCTITESFWGTGVALVSFNAETPSDKPTKFFGRNVITIDGGDGGGRFDGIYST